MRNFNNIPRATSALAIACVLLGACSLESGNPTQAGQEQSQDVQYPDELPNPSIPAVPEYAELQGVDVEIEATYEGRDDQNLIKTYTYNGVLGPAEVFSLFESFAYSGEDEPFVAVITHTLFNKHQTSVVSVSPRRSDGSGIDLGKIFWVYAGYCSANIDLPRDELADLYVQAYGHPYGEPLNDPDSPNAVHVLDVPSDGVCLIAELVEDSPVV